MSFPRAKRFTDPKLCGPGVGTYTPTEKTRALCAKFLGAERFKEDSVSCDGTSTSGTPFKRPTTPMHLPKEKLLHKMAELLQQLEDRDQLISQLRISKNKLSLHVGQLEGLLRNVKKRAEKGVKAPVNAARATEPEQAEAAAEVFTEVGSFPKDAEERPKELRLTKETWELREELWTFMDGLDDEAGEGSEQGPDDQVEIVVPEPKHPGFEHEDLVQQMSLLRQEKEELQNRMAAWQSEQNAISQQQAELTAKLQKDLDDANTSISHLKEILIQKDEKICKVSEMLEHEKARQAEVTAITLQLHEELEDLMSLKVSLETELAKVKMQCEEADVDRAAAEDTFLQARDTIDELKEKLLRASEKEGGLSTELIALKAYIAVLQTEKQELEEDLASVRENANHFSAETSQLENEICMLRSHKLSLEAQVTDLVADKTQLQKEVLIQTSQTDAALAEGQRLEANLRSLKEQQQLLEENIQVREKAAQEQVALLQAEKEQLKSSALCLQHELTKVQSDLFTSYNSEREAKEQLHSWMLELDVERSRNEILRGEVAAKVQALTELQISLEEALGTLQEAKLREAETAMSLECATSELHVADMERTDLAKKNDELRGMCDLMAEQIATLKGERQKFVVVSRELDRENHQLRKDLQHCGEGLDRQLNELQKKLEDATVDAERWRNDYEVLQARVAPFQLQLELYDVERCHLVERNQATESELSRLHKKFSEMMGHQNHKQKIHYLSKIAEERKQYQTEVLKLQEQNLKQMKIIQKLELEVKRCSLKPPLASRKENVLPEDQFE